MKIESGNRFEQLTSWLKSLNNAFELDVSSLVPASSDASFRRYFRVSGVNKTFIVMDAPPEHEDCLPFINIASLFANAGVAVPQVLAQNLTQGFLLLTDLGNTTFLSALKVVSDEARLPLAHHLYLGAFDALLAIQQASKPDVLPNYDDALLRREIALFPEWYLGKHLGLTLSATQQAQLANVYDVLVAQNLSQAQVYVHRDYHARNLMVNEKDNQHPGVLDFQDAVYGPITYDLVSLLRDAYIAWDEEQQLDWVIRYWEKAKKAGLPVPSDASIFYQDFEWMGLQRHLKVLGIFARLYHRDGKDGYLADIPLVFDYAHKVAKRYQVFAPLANLFDQIADAPTTTAYTF